MFPSASLDRRTQLVSKNRYFETRSAIDYPFLKNVRLAFRVPPRTGGVSKRNGGNGCCSTESIVNVASRSLLFPRTSRWKSTEWRETMACNYSRTLGRTRDGPVIRFPFAPRPHCHRHCCRPSSSPPRLPRHRWPPRVGWNIVVDQRREKKNRTKVLRREGSHGRCTLRTAGN